MNGLYINLPVMGKKGSARIWIEMDTFPANKASARSSAHNLSFTSHLLKNPGLYHSMVYIFWNFCFTSLGQSRFPSTDLVAES